MLTMLFIRISTEEQCMIRILFTWLNGKLILTLLF